MSTLRVVRSGFVMNLKMLGTSSFFLLTSTVQPVIFATIAFCVLVLRHAALGGGVWVPLAMLALLGAVSIAISAFAAARQVAAGAPLSRVAGLVWTEAGIAVAYAAAGFVLFRYLERASRRSAVLDAY